MMDSRGRARRRLRAGDEEATITICGERGEAGKRVKPAADEVERIKIGYESADQDARIVIQDGNENECVPERAERFHRAAIGKLSAEENAAAWREFSKLAVRCVRHGRLWDPDYVQTLAPVFLAIAAEAAEIKRVERELAASGIAEIRPNPPGTSGSAGRPGKS